MSLFINPGTGPVANATEEHAEANIRVLLTDAGVTDAEFVRLPQYDNDGRYAFLLFKNTWNSHMRAHLVQMPGLPLDKVRFMDEEHQNIWDFPRLYVDGSSWVWKFAISCVSPAGFDPDQERDV